MLYPLKFEPVYKNYIWGGRNLEKLGRKLPEGKIAESWEISCHPDGTSIISNGEYRGTSLIGLIKTFKNEILGTDVYKQYKDRFPLLVKFIDANDDLSVQVHPGDDYVRENESEEFGKNEMWYVISAEPGTKLVYNLTPGISKHDFKDAISKKQIYKCLNYVDVFPGDVIYIPTGTVHALGKGIIVAEIQQNSNVTYRVYDYDRVGPGGNKRPLHIDKALDVINFDKPNSKEKVKGLKISHKDNSSTTYLAANRYFAVELYSVNGSIKENTDNSRFHIFVVLEGEGKFWFGNNQSVEFKKLESVLIPASLGEYSVYGKFKALKAYVPNLESDVIAPLRNAGYSDEDIINNVGGLVEELAVIQNKSA